MTKFYGILDFITLIVKTRCTRDGKTETEYKNVQQDAIIQYYEEYEMGKRCIPYGGSEKCVHFSLAHNNI
jgi:hypothetical protein